MKSKLLAAALLGTALLSGAAYAQTATTDRSNVNTAVHKDGQWRASKLIGVNVYNDNNDKIGEIEELSSTSPPRSRTSCSASAASSAWASITSRFPWTS